jgi:hypothetical protein
LAANEAALAAYEAWHFEKTGAAKDGPLGEEIELCMVLERSSTPALQGDGFVAARTHRCDA